MKGIGTIVTMLLIGIVATAGAVTAFGGFDGRFDGASEDRAAVDAALEENDYDAWVDAMNAQHADMLTEEHFEEMATHHAAMAEKRAEREETREALDAALEADDYDEWRDIVDSMEHAPPVASIGKEDFEILVQLHEARQAGDDDLVEELREELDLPMGRGFGGQGNGDCQGGEMRGQGRGHGMGGQGLGWA